MDLRIKEAIKEKGSSIQELADKIGDALRVPVTELFEQPKTGTASSSCPHCRKSINIKAE